jgi:hypothetical protein
MEKFLQKMQEDLENKILSCVKGESIIKPFSQIYERAREKNEQQKKDDKKGKYIGDVFLGDESIYVEIINEYLNKNPEFLNNNINSKEKE